MGLLRPPLPVAFGLSSNLSMASVMLGSDDPPPPPPELPLPTPGKLVMGGRCIEDAPLPAPPAPLPPLPPTAPPRASSSDMAVLLARILLTCSRAPLGGASGTTVRDVVLYGVGSSTP